MVDCLRYFIHTTSLAHNRRMRNLDSSISTCKEFHRSSVKDSSSASSSGSYTEGYAFWLGVRFAVREISQRGAYQALSEASAAVVWRRYRHRSVCSEKRRRQNVRYRPERQRENPAYSQAAVPPAADRLRHIWTDE